MARPVHPVPPPTAMTRFEREAGPMRPRAMIVDDNAEIRVLARAVLERSGFDVDEADTAIVALDLLDAAEPDVIVLDHRLDHLTGLELASVIRFRYPRPRIL